MAKKAKTLTPTEKAHVELDERRRAMATAAIGDGTTAAINALAFPDRVNLVRELVEGLEQADEAVSAFWTTITVLENKGYTRDQIVATMAMVMKRAARGDSRPGRVGHRLVAELVGRGVDKDAVVKALQSKGRSRKQSQEHIRTIEKRDKQRRLAPRKLGSK